MEGAKDVLPDLLAPGLRLVFCGTAAGPTSARLGQYYAGAGNRFWPMLHDSGLTPHRFRPADYALLLDLGIGLTDVAKLAWGLDHQLPREELGAAARRRLLAKIEALRPRILAFTSKRAAQAALGAVAAYGPQAPLPGGTLPWVLPSPSGLARRWWDPGPWRDLGDAVRAISPPRDEGEASG